MQDLIVAHFVTLFCDFYFWGEFADITFQGPQFLIYKGIFVHFINYRPI